MTITTDPATTQETKYVSSLIKTASDKPLVKSSFSLIAGTYSTVSKYVKPVCPGAITTKWEATEKYIVDNQDYLVDNADGYVNLATKFVADVNEARKKNEAAEFILTTVEGLVKEEDGFETADEDEDVAEEAASTPTSSSRIYGITGAVSKTFYKKATSGLGNLKERTNDVVHVDLMNYANTFIDASVKPKYDYVAGLPTTVAEKFSSYAEPIKAQAQTKYDSVQLAVKDNVVDPVKNVYEMKVKEGKSTTEVVVCLKNNVLVGWNDKVVVPVATYFDVPNLHYSTVKPLAVDFVSKNYNTYSNTASIILNKFTATPIADLKYTEIPASVFAKVTTELSDRYLEQTGKEFDVKSAPLEVFHLVIANAHVIAVIDYVKPYAAAMLKMSGEEKVKSE